MSIDRPSISGAVSTTRTQRFLVRGRYPGNLQCCVGVLSRYRVWWTIGPAQCRLISRLRYPRLRVAVWGLHSLKTKNLLGDRSPFHRTPVAGWFVPFFYLQIFTRTSIIFSNSSAHFFIRVAYTGVFSFNIDCYF